MCVVALGSLVLESFFCALHSELELVPTLKILNADHLLSELSLHIECDSTNRTLPIKHTHNIFEAKPRDI